MLVSRNISALKPYFYYYFRQSFNKLGLSESSSHNSLEITNKKWKDYNK